MRPVAVETVPPWSRPLAAVVNCAGPFLDTGLPVAAAAVRAGAHYLDVAAEQAAVQSLYRTYEELRWRTDVAVVQAMAFFGGLADLLATAAVAEWGAVDESGRSAQRFAADVVAGAGDEEGRILAAGRDIYAVTAPLLVEAAQRLLDGRRRSRVQPRPEKPSTPSTS